MKKRKLFPKNSIDNLRINYTNIPDKYKFKLPKDRKTEGPFNFGFFEQVMGSVPTHHMFMRGVPISRTLRGAKMSCVIVDDFAFRNPKNKSKFRGMTNEMDWGDAVLMKPEDIKKKYAGVIPIKEKGKTLEELVSEATGIPIDELNIYPVDIDWGDSPIHRALTLDELKNGIVVNYTFDKSRDTETKSEEIILSRNETSSTQSFDDMQEEWLQRIAAEYGIPKHMLQQVYENTDGWKYIFHSKVMSLFWINVGKMGEHAHKAVDKIQKLDKSLSKHNDLNNVRIIYRLYKEFIKWVDSVYGDYVSMPERIKELWMWIRYRLHQCKWELNSNYGFSEANGPHDAGWHMDARLGENLDPFKKQCGSFQDLLFDTTKGAAPKGEPPMSEQKDKSESFVAHLPKGCIYELLGEEEIDHDKSEVIRDARGKIMEYKWCKKEINTSNARGIVIAYPDDKKKMVMVGMACCEADEKFDFGKHVIQALQNACDHNYGQDGIYVGHIKAFFSRCRVEFPQLEDADWGVSFYNRGGI